MLNNDVITIIYKPLIKLHKNWSKNDPKAMKTKLVPKIVDSDPVAADLNYSVTLIVLADCTFGTFLSKTLCSYLNSTFYRRPLDTDNCSL